MKYISIAWGNMLRNRRRTLSTLAAIAAGAGMIVIAAGFTGGVTGGMTDSLVNQIDGQMDIEHKDYRKYFISDQERILIRDSNALAAELKKDPRVRAVLPRVVTGGIMGMDDRSTTFVGVFYDLASLPVVLPDYAKNLVEGLPLSTDDPDGVLVGRALAKDMGLALGDEVALLSKTVHGEQSNALARVRGIVTFPTDPAVEQSLVIGGLEKGFRENLLDLGNGATQLLVRLDDIESVPELEKALGERFARESLPWRVVPWYESKTFSQMVGMLNGINRVIMIVLAVMVGVITSASLLMAFFERINEIGSLRAIGMTRGDVYRMLYTESALMAAIGTAAGLAFGSAVVMTAGHWGVPLGGFVNQEVHPTLTAASLAAAALAPVLAILAAAFAPIHSALRMSVVDSLNFR